MINFEYKGKNIKILRSNQNYFINEEDNVEIGIKLDSLYDSTKQSLELVSTRTLAKQRTFLLQETEKEGDYSESELFEFREMARAISDILTEREGEN